MSYWCHASNEAVSGEKRVLVPTKIRKVIYIAQQKPDDRSDYLQFAGQTEGWEVVEEVPVRQSRAVVYQETYKPIIVSQKEVRFLLPRKQKEKYVRRNDEMDNDKPEE